MGAWSEDRPRGRRVPQLPPLAATAGSLLMLQLGVMLAWAAVLYPLAARLFRWVLIPAAAGASDVPAVPHPA